jgi:hypothetical protein
MEKHVTEVSGDGGSSGEANARLEPEIHSMRVSMGSAAYLEKAHREYLMKLQCL